MTTIVNRQRRVTVTPVRPRVVTLDRSTVARLEGARRTVTQPQKTNAVVKPESPRVVVTGANRPGGGSVGPTGPAGPAGATGPAGRDGQIRYTGHGPPPIVIVGSIPGDTYCDLDTGIIYKLM